MIGLLIAFITIQILFIVAVVTDKTCPNKYTKICYDCPFLDRCAGNMP